MADIPETHADAASFGSSLLVWFGLVALTGLTVALAGIDLGRWLILTSLGIASVKSLLVLRVFMHLKKEDPAFRVFVLAALVTLGVFISFTFFDYAF
ncbi:MAG: cytochrome C oxidase subunit IV family protein [Bacteroidota bacterium]